MVLHTVTQSLTCVEMLELKQDHRIDDYLLFDMHKETDQEEPTPLGRDSMQPDPEVKTRPTFQITMGTSGGSKDFNIAPKELSVSGRSDRKT